MSARHDHEQGMVLPMALFIILILSILGAALLTQSNFSSRVMMNGDSKMQAYYVAESGAKAVDQYLVNNPTELDEILLVDEANCESNWTELDAAHRFKVTVERRHPTPESGETSSVKITSTGAVSSGSTVTNSTVHLMLYGNELAGFSWENAVWNQKDEEI